MKLTDTNDPRQATSLQDFMDRARLAGFKARFSSFPWPPAGKFELNSYAEVIAASDVAEALKPAAARLLELLQQSARAAEEGMLQLAFFNQLGLVMPNWWLVLAYGTGWRYRLDLGFHQVAADQKEKG